MYSTLKRCPGLLAWDKLGKRIALDTALGLNYLHARCPPKHWLWSGSLPPCGAPPCRLLLAGGPYALPVRTCESHFWQPVC